MLRLVKGTECLFRKEKLFSLVCSDFCPRDCGHSVDELGPEQNVGVVEHAVLERHHDELGALEVGLEHVANVLGVTEIQGRVHLV